MGNGARRIDVWPIVEVSLCPQNQAVELRAKVSPLKTIAAGITPFAQMMDQRERIAAAKAKAREVHIEILKDRFERSQREHDRSQLLDSISEEYDYYNATRPVKIDKYERTMGKK